MKSNKYTLDRFEEQYAIFLKRPAEVEQLLIPINELPASLQQGDIVTIEDTGQRYTVKKLHNETAQAKARISSLLQQLQRGEHKD